MISLAVNINLENFPSLIEKYKQHHKEVWPEVLYSIRRSGIRRSKIFLLGTRLFLLVEAKDNFQGDQLQNYTICERETEWDLLMRTYQIPEPEAKPGVWWRKWN